LVLKTEP
jgi:hypothetical protein